MRSLDPRFPRHGRLAEEAAARTSENDLSHDIFHVERVYSWAIRLAAEAEADPDLAGAAALVHDLVSVPKESMTRSLAGEQSALASAGPLSQAGYSSEEVAAITEAVRTSSWSSGLAPTSSLGAVIQDADRLDAIGAIGVARTLACSQAMVSRGRHMRLYDPVDPLRQGGRPPDEEHNALDHFFVKLLKLAEGMHLPSARAEAERRQAAMQSFLEQLARELASVDTAR